MSWITIIWSMNAAVCLTLAGIHLTVWLNSRKLWGHLLFSCSAVAAAGVAAGELLLMRSETVEQCGMVIQWTQVPVWLLVVSIVGFTRFHLRAGRPWLAWVTVGMRTVVLVLNFLTTPNINFQTITHLNRIPFLGELISLPQGTAHPWEIFARLSSVLLLAFLVNATVEVWRRGKRRRAVLLGGSMIFFITVAAVHFALLERGVIQSPYIISLAYLGTVLVMAYELSREVLQAMHVKISLQKSEADLRESETQLLKSREELKEQLAFERLATEISSALMRAPAKELDEQIPPAMGQVAQFLGFDASTLALFTGNDTDALLPYVWTAPDTPGLPANLTDKDFPWSACELIAGRDVHIRTLDDFPPEGQIDRATYERHGLKSALDVPIFVSGQIMGVFSLGSFRKEQSVPPQLVERQRVLGNIFGNAIVRARSETALRESEEKLALAATAAELGLWSWDMINDEIWATEKARALFGFTSSEPIEFEKFLLKLHPDDREPVTHAVAKSMNGDGDYESVHRLLLPDRPVRWIAARGRVECNDVGKPVRMRGVSQDITARKQAELEVQQQRNELAHLSRVATVSELSGSLAHELNQPLGIILSNAQAAQELLLQDPPVVSEVGEILSDIVAADRRASEIIVRLRALLKRGESLLLPLSLNDLLEEVLRLVRADLIGRGVSVVCEWAPNLPPVNGDRVQLQQVALNLILNAADAMAANAPGQRRMHITTIRLPHAIRASVRDEGSGLPANIEQIFQPFFTTKVHGLGMGLAICRSIIAAHRGRLWAEPHPERGAIFHFELPVTTTSDYP